MAKKRLNKKVALIGSAVFVLLSLAAIGVVLRLSQDPQEFIKDAEAALKAARQATNEDVKKEKYETAERSYSKARSLAKTDSLRIEMLFKLVQLYIETDRWRNALGCWNNIARIDPENVKARYARLKYFYILADTGARQLWQEVESQSTELIELAENADLLAEDTAQWESFEVREEKAGIQPLGPYLYLLRGRAILEMARLGAVTDREESLERAIGDLERVRELEQGSVEVYSHLAQAVITKGNLLASRGNLEERDKTREQAKELLEQAVEVAPDDVGAHVNRLTIKRDLVIAQGDREQIQSLEPEYLALVEKFASSAQAHLELARFYHALGPKGIDEAIKAAEKAIELDQEDAACAIEAANLHYRRFSVYGESPSLYRAVELAKNALKLPDAKEITGPRRLANRMNRVSLHFFLANCYIEQILEPCETRTELQNKEWLENAQQVVREIEQLVGSGDDPRVIMWQGLLELAKGNKNVAVRKMYAAYEQLKAGGMEEVQPSLAQRSYARLSRVLAKIFEGTSEIGAVRNFLAAALRTGISQDKPETLLDYADVLLTLGDSDGALSAVNFFENQYWTNERSQALRISIYCEANQFDEAENELADARPDDPNTIKLKLALVSAKIAQVQRAITRKQRAESLGPAFYEVLGIEKEGVESQLTELESYQDAFAELVGKLLSIEPNSVEEGAVAAVCENYLAEEKIEQAKAMVNRFLKYFPQSTTVLLYKKMLSETEPVEISKQKRKEIEEQVLSDIANPEERSVKLGVLYQTHNEPNKAAEEFRKVLNMQALQEAGVEVVTFDQAEEITDAQRLAADYLLEIALDKSDWELARQVVNVARSRNIDGCEGNFFASRLAVAEEHYKDALARVEECLRQRPIFSNAFMLRSNINSALANELASIEDAQKAASLNPLDATIAKGQALRLYQRDQKLGDNVLSDQLIETRAALDRAMVLNQDDLELRSFYAEYIAPRQPMRALAIRQELQRTAPSMENAILLGRLATRTALRLANAERKEALFAIAGAAFEQARAIDPYDKTMLFNCAEYYRVRGEDEKAEQLLVEAQDQSLLWQHHFRSGRLGDARDVLERIYQADANDAGVVRGLLLVAEKTADQQAAKKYSEELLSLQSNVQNHLLVVQTFLRIGLVKEAEYQLQSLKERYPDEARALLLEAWLAMRQGRLKEALQLTNRNLENNQDDAMAWRIRGEINLLRADYGQAIIDLKRSKSLLAEPATRVILAKAYRRAGRYEDAITELRSTIGQPQAPAEAMRLLEEVLLQRGRKEDLRRFYDGIVSSRAGSVLWCNRAAAFEIAEGNFDSAVRLYQHAWQISTGGGKGDVAALDGYLQALVLSGELDKVFEEAGKHVDGEFAPVAFFRMADAKLKLGDRASAVEYCHKAVDKAGTNALFMSDIVQKMNSLLGPRETLAYCEEKLQLDPDSLANNLAMFNLTNLNREYNKAIGYIDKCLQIIGPDSPDKVNYTITKAETLTLAYAKTSDKSYLDRAIAVHESLLAELPNNANVLNNLAYLLAENDERLTDALEYARRAYEAMPNSAGFLDTYAYVLYKNGRYAEAAEFLQAALQQYEQNRISMPPEVFEHLGMINEELGATAEALAAYERALETGTDELPPPAVERIESAVERLTQQGGGEKDL
ncbi:MAG: tetratricopeptide repeat protein [Planctomycetota bacterium]|nr:MAG: tetratricopeptide repeat protein [Planctomycetota bacterium]